MTARKLKKLLIDARKIGIIITSYKQGLYYAKNNTAYTELELLLSVYGNDYAPSWLKKVEK
jgi:hypothetical protein